MTGYLARIVQQHVAPPAGAVMPRRPGWFEPLIPSIQARWPEETESDRTTGVADPGVAAPERPAAPAESPAVSANPLAGSAPVTPTGPPRSATSAAMAHRRLPSPATSVPDHVAPEIVRAPVHATASRVRPQPNRLTGDLEADFLAASTLPVRHERGREPMKRGAPSPADPPPPDVPSSVPFRRVTATEQVIPPAARPATRARDPVDARDDSIHTSVRERQGRIVAGTLRATAGDTRRAAPPLPPAGPAPEAAPHTIEVSIGRIEVRATPASDAQAKRRPTPATMTLQEYLSRRAGGGGR